MNIEDQRAALNLAKDNLLAHHKKVDELIFSARKRIENTYSKERKLLEQRVSSAELDLSYAVDDRIAANPHEFEGKKVSFLRWKLTGTFETVTSQTRFSKRDYAKPSVGTYIVWTKGKTYVRVHDIADWKLQ